MAQAQGGKLNNSFIVKRCCVPNLEKLEAQSNQPSEAKGVANALSELRSLQYLIHTNPNKIWTATTLNISHIKTTKKQHHCESHTFIYPLDSHRLHSLRKSSHDG